ncbi:MAG: signal peptidase I [Lachnospirales bacterium]
MEGVENKGFKTTLKVLCLFFFIFTIAISTKLFVGDIYKIPSSSMNSTLYSGDVILVNKLKYGPKLPRSPFEIPLVNISLYFNKKAKERIKENWWAYKRLSGLSQVKQGDIFVFSLGLSRNFFVVKRCSGLPGDTLQIKNGKVYTNGNLYNETDNIMNSFEFRIENRQLLHKQLDSLSISTYINYSQPKTGTAILSKKEANLFQGFTSISDFQLKIDTFDVKKTVLRASEHNKWTYDNMGPIVIPKKGMTIALKPSVALLYGEIMKLHEKNPVEIKDDRCYIYGQEKSSYTFKQNYYFMMGDNRKKTIDSRSWGFLPEENIIGKVQCVLWSNYQDKFQWERLFKAVD